MSGLRGWVLLGVFAALSAFALVQWRAADVARLELSDYRGAVERDRRLEAEKAGRELKRLRDEQTGILDAEIQRRKAAEADVGRAAAAGRGLQQQLAAARARYAVAAPGAAGECQAASAAVAVLADLLGRCSERRRELARFADESYAAGRVCERLADSEVTPGE